MADQVTRQQIEQRVAQLPPPEQVKLATSICEQLSPTSLGASGDPSLGAFYTVGLQICTHPGLILRVREIAHHLHRGCPYDSLSERLGALRSCEFWTTDKTFYDAVKGGCRL